MNFFLEIVRLFILVTIVVVLWKSGAGKANHAKIGWRCILGGFFILIGTEFVFIFDEYLPMHGNVLSDYGVEDDLLGKTVGYVGGLLLLSFGLLQWVPDIKRLTKEITERTNSEEELMRTYDNVRVLVREQTAELQMAVDGLEGEVKERKLVEEELGRHQKHLEDLVVQRTKEVYSQAVQLEKALEQEKEYSARQREFVSLVSHEFRTPLTIIDGSAQRMMRRKDKLTSDEVVIRGSKIRQAVQRMTGLIEATLYASSIDEGKIKLTPGVCNIKQIIKDVCTRQVEISPAHPISVDIDQLPNNILADCKLLDQVVANLVSNAVKYSPDSSDIHVRGWMQGGDAFVAVRDYGVGISEVELPRLFERFFRAHTAEGIPGTGIGLSIAKKMIELHRGDIWVESVEGEGTTFTFKVPTHLKNINSNSQPIGLFEGAGI